MNRQPYIDQITDALALLSRQVEIKAALNLALGYQLENINAINPNAAAIDLGDSHNKIAIQVTSDPTLAKSRQTVEKFIEKEL